MLEQERALFATHREELLVKYPGLFVVIKNDSVVGAFSTESEALACGAREFGLRPFLVRNVNQPANIEITIPELSLGILRADLGRND